MPEKATYEELEQRIKELEQAESEHKKVEEALRESEERYKNIFTNNHSVMLIINPENADIVDANPAAISFYGWTHCEITHKKITDINILSEEQVFQEMDRAKQENRRNFYFRHRHANGDIRDVEVYSGPIKLYGKKLLFSIIHDITDRIKAEEAIKVLSKFPSENPNPVMRVGKDGIILYGNKASTSLLEIWKCQLGHRMPDEWCEFILNILKFDKSQEAEIKHEDRIISLSFTPVSDSGYVNIYGQDVTERKRAEAERENLINKLQDALKEVKALRGILPLCSFCKKIRDDKGDWESVDVYIHKHSQADISHSICPECAKKYYPDYNLYKK